MLGQLPRLERFCSDSYIHHQHWPISQTGNITHRVQIQTFFCRDGRADPEYHSSPSSEEDTPLEYVDQSLTILGRTFDAYNQKMEQVFLHQCEFIASQFRKLENQVVERFKQWVDNLRSWRWRWMGASSKCIDCLRNEGVRFWMLNSNMKMLQQSPETAASVECISLSISSIFSCLLVTPTCTCGPFIIKYPHIWIIHIFGINEHQAYLSLARRKQSMYLMAYCFI